MGKKAGGVIGKDEDFYFCDLHTDTIIHHYDVCPVCVDIRELNSEIRELKAKLTKKNKTIKLLKYELQEERTLHSAHKLEVAEYLAQKRLVDNLVKDRLK